MCMYDRRAEVYFSFIFGQTFSINDIVLPLVCVVLTDHFLKRVIEISPDQLTHTHTYTNKLTQLLFFLSFYLPFFTQTPLCTLSRLLAAVYGSV